MYKYWFNTNLTIVFFSYRYEQAFLTSLTGLRPEKYFWIGLSNIQEKGTFKWTNDEAVLFTHWNSEMPGIYSTTTLVGGSTGPTLQYSVFRLYIYVFVIPLTIHSVSSAGLYIGWQFSDASLVKGIIVRNFGLLLWCEWCK